MAKVERHQNHGLRKICECPRRAWAKCAHSWHFSFKPRGGTFQHRFSVDREAGKHIESKTEAEALADTWRAAIRAGTFRRAQGAAAVMVAAAPDVLTLAVFLPRYYERRK